MIGFLAIFIWIGIPAIICFLLGTDNKLVMFLLCGVFGIIAFIFYGVARAVRDQLGNRTDPYHYKSVYYHHQSTEAEAKNVSPRPRATRTHERKISSIITEQGER